MQLTRGKGTPCGAFIGPKQRNVRISLSLSLGLLACSRPLWRERERASQAKSIPQNAPFRILSGQKTESVMEEHIPAPNSNPEYRSALTPTSSIALRTCAHATLVISISSLFYEYACKYLNFEFCVLILFFFLFFFSLLL